MFKLRVISAILGIPVLLLISWLGNWFFVAGVILLATLGWLEFRNMTQEMELIPPNILGLVLVVIFPIAAYFDSNGTSLQILVHLPFVVLFLTTAGFIISYPKYSLMDTAVTLWGVLYIGGLFSFWVLLRESTQGFNWLLFAFIITWAVDTGAYLVGRKWGRCKPWPNLSPNKTIAGAVGGMIFSVITSLFVAEVFALWGGLLLKPSWAILLGLILGITAQAGDLVESGIKRLAKVKDSGSLIPGHGGVLDRFDSLLLTIPTVYYFVLFVSGCGR